MTDNYNNWKTYIWWISLLSSPPACFLYIDNKRGRDIGAFSSEWAAAAAETLLFNVIDRSVDAGKALKSEG
jgi:hypothetical protein